MRDACLRLKEAVPAATVTLKQQLAALVQESLADKCPLSNGYWKNHTNSWPVTSMVLGTQTYSKTELVRS